MGKYDHYLEEKICPGKSYRSYRKLSKEKRAVLIGARLVILKKEKKARDIKNAGIVYYPWPDIWDR